MWMLLGAVNDLLNAALSRDELYALVEGSKEALGARCAVGHILGHEGDRSAHLLCFRGSSQHLEDGGLPKTMPHRHSCKLKFRLEQSK